MKESNGGYGSNYNVQIDTDSANKIILGVGVSQDSSDYRELVVGIKKVEKNCLRQPKQIVVDGGFISRENIIAMKRKEIDLIGGMKDMEEQRSAILKGHGISKSFYVDKFEYKKDKDEYRCPGGKILTYKGKEKRPGVTKYIYRADGENCRVCSFMSKCCPENNKKGRAIMRIEEASEIIEFRMKMGTEEAKKIYKQRGAVSEFPNAWIKSKIRLRQFRLRGLLKVEIEALWACLTYNIKQWIRLCWKPQLVQVTA